MAENKLLHVTKDGFTVDFLSDEVTKLCLYDVLDGLSKEHRFSNRIPWSVLQHSIVVGLAAQFLYDGNFPLIQKAFTHDFQECVVRDVPTPFKDYVGTKWYAMEDMIQKKLLSRFGIDAGISSNDEKLLLEIDRVAGYVEATHFFGAESEIVQEMSKNAQNYNPTVVITVTRLFYQILSSFQVYDESGILSDETLRIYKDVIVANKL